MTGKFFKNKRALSFWGLILVFFLPLILAIGLYATRNHWQLESKPHGELLNPPLTLTTHFDNKANIWQVLYITPTCDDAACDHQRTKIISVQEATGKDYERVIANVVTTSALPQGLYIMDPHGYIILKYPPEASGMDMLQDLRHLLKVSQIG